VHDFGSISWVLHILWQCCKSGPAKKNPVPCFLSHDGVRKSDDLCCIVRRECWGSKDGDEGEMTGKAGQDGSDDDGQDDDDDADRMVMAGRRGSGLSSKLESTKREQVNLELGGGKSRTPTLGRTP